MKVGDIVICIDDSHSKMDRNGTMVQILTKGNSYIVKGIGDLIDIGCGMGQAWFPDRFKVAEPGTRDYDFVEYFKRGSVKHGIVGTCKPKSSLDPFLRKMLEDHLEGRALKSTKEYHELKALLQNSN